MNDWLNIFYFSTDSAALLLSVMGLWLTVIMPGIERWSKRFFRCYFAVLMVCCFSGFIELIVYHYPVSGAAMSMILLVEILPLSIPLPMLTVYLLHCCSEEIRSGRLFRTVLGLWVIFFIMLVSIRFNNIFIRVTPEGRYYTGPLYPLLMAPIIAILLLNLAGTLRRRAKLSRKTFLSFVIAQVPMAAALILNLFVDIAPLFYISVVISAMAMFSLILSDQIEQDLYRQREIARQQQEIARQQREIAHERSSVMVLRMRPHFIYNTLMSIYSLCRLDPLKARQITMDFTNYLRRNFNAVASDSTIPFSTELEHTRAYLAVEKAQYDDMLVVDYDTPFTRFRLPPLTLQPVVENAVKHGMNLYSGPLQVLVRTRQTESGAEILVEDNGTGFDASDESGSHTTLTNIRQRLEMMCGGSLTIDPREGGGTTVMIRIPLNVSDEFS